MAVGSPEHPVALFELQQQLSNEAFSAGMFPFQAGLLLVVFMDLEGFGGMGQELIAPLVVLGLIDLVLGAPFGYGLPLETLKDNHRFGLGIPFPTWHG
jgi:hypothetical protein